LKEKKKACKEKRREREKGVPKICFSYPPLYKTLVFSLSFLAFQHIINYINTHQKECNRHHNETFSLQTKSITQILKIKKIATT
jgi:uncharacterized membrane protein